MVVAATLSGFGIPLFKQSIMSAMTESASHSVPNKL
jgi:Tfp pilus assembly protein FimT